MKYRAAFTFAQTLVISSVGILLAGLLLPSLDDAKQKLQATQCLSNMRQWGMAIGMYCNDYQDYMPFDGLATDITQGFSLVAWYNVLPHYINQPPLKDLYSSSPPNIPLPGSRSIYICPSAPAISYTPTAAKPYFSYAMNRCNVGLSGRRYPRSKSALPAQVILLSESENDEYPFTDGYYIGVYGTPPANTPRHFGGRNFVFVDGHAAWYATNDYSRTAAEMNNGTGSLIEWIHNPPYKIYWWPCRNCPKQ
jgi:prepilin-type processing-associated H-X9-DG protein